MRDASPYINIGPPPNLWAMHGYIYKNILYIYREKCKQLHIETLLPKEKRGKGGQIFKIRAGAFKEDVCVLFGAVINPIIAV